MSQLKKLINDGLSVMNKDSVRTLSKLEDVGSLKVSPRGRLSVPKIVISKHKLSSFNWFLPLLRNDPNGNPFELVLYLMNDKDKEISEQQDHMSGFKRIHLYDQASNEPTTSYFELGPQLKEIGLLDKAQAATSDKSDKKKSGFMLEFRVEEMMLILRVDKKY